ncbi:MAG: glycoside hydrolase family 78 protein [Propionibacteriaceae bacterium]|jgi:alpha-L-rhamnosidase|nr:glycoside hydrolase family 78 protein [Propionibacteriaceae bacterium]
MFTVTNLRCEFAERPLGLGTARPRFSWEALTSEPERTVAGYQILVATSVDKLANDIGDLWDSGQQDMPLAPLIEYAGAALHSRQRPWWKVRLWDDRGRPGPYSEPDWFEIALLDSADWRADWLGHAGSSSRGALYLRRPFVLADKPIRARLYVTGLGWYEAHLNGAKVGSRVLDPAPTDTSVRVPYSTFDVTDLLHEGDNVLGAILGHGWAGSHKLLAQLEISLADGSDVVVATGNHLNTPGWMAYLGPIVDDSIYDGQTYDSRLENPGWADGGLDFVAAPMRELFHAMVVDAPGGSVEAQPQEPIEVVETRAPVAITAPRPGLFVVDTGQNLAGWVRLAADGPRGTQVTLRYAESLHADGTVDQENLRSAQAQDTFILAGRGRQVWEPTFTYHGFRYVEIEGYPGELRASDVDVQVVRSAMSFRGHFTCDNDLVNAISEAVRWTEASNVHGVPTDCPQRNERMGWLNDLAARSEELVHTFDTSRFLPKWVQDIADIQDSVGAITDTAPYHFGARPADPVSVCYALIPWLMITHHGDLRTAATHFDGIRRWYDYLTSRATGRIVSYSYYGDWAPPEGESLECDDGVSAIAANTPGALISTAHYYLTALLLQRMAQALGRDEDAKQLAADAAAIKAAFHAEFYRGPGIGYGSGNQACNAIALYLNLVPTNNVADTVAALVADIRAHDTHLTTGNLCTKYILETLVDHGHADLALELVTQTTYPSWGYMLSNGATTIWERWEHATGGGMNSHNHPMYASVGAWFYRRLAGIQVPDDAIGMSRVIIRPALELSLSHACAELSTVRGTLRSAWNRVDDKVSLTIQVPVGIEAELCLPLEFDVATDPADPVVPCVENNSASSHDRAWLLRGGTTYRIAVSPISAS